MIFSSDSNKPSLGSKQHTLHEDTFPSYATIQFRDFNTSSRMNTKSTKSLLQSRASRDRDSINDEKTSSSSNGGGGGATQLGIHSSRATTSASFELIKSSLMARHKNTFVCPNFVEAGIAPVLLPESVARDFQDRCFTTSRFKKLRHYAPKLPDDDRTFIEEYEELVEIEKRKSSRNNYSSQQHSRQQKADEELLFQHSNEKTVLSLLPPAVKKSEVQTKSKINLKIANDQHQQQQKNLLYFYRQSGTNKYDWSMNQNMYARKFNVHCSAPKSWLKLKYSKNHDGFS